MWTDKARKQSLVWIDHNSHDGEHYKNMRMQLQKFEGLPIQCFEKYDEFDKFFQNNPKMSIWMIVTGSIGESCKSKISENKQIEFVYIFCRNTLYHSTWALGIPKISGVYKKMDDICDQLKLKLALLCPCFIPTSFSVQDPSCGLAKIWREFLTNSEVDINLAKKDFIKYALGSGYLKKEDLDFINKFVFDEVFVNWFLSNSSLYSLLNRSLYYMDVEALYRMRFLIAGIHDCIRNHYSKRRRRSYTPIRAFRIVLLREGYETMKGREGTFLSFNNFLLISHTTGGALNMFDRKEIKNYDLNAVLLNIRIDHEICENSSIQYMPVTLTTNQEQQVDGSLFTTHTIFRIDSVTQTEEHNQHLSYRMNISLVRDNDQIGAEIFSTINEVARENCNSEFSHFEYILQAFKKLRDVKLPYEKLLQDTQAHNSKANRKDIIGDVLSGMEDYANALNLYQEALQLREKVQPVDHSACITSYNNIADICKTMGDHGRSQKYYNLALSCLEKNFSDDFKRLAICHGNIGSLHFGQGEYERALKSYKKAVEFHEKSTSSNMSGFAAYYCNIGTSYYNMGKYENALEYFERDLQITKQVSPRNDRNLVISYNKVGNANLALKKTEEAIKYFQKAHVIVEQSLLGRDIIAAYTYNNFGMATLLSGKAEDASQYFQTALEIQTAKLPENHSDIGRCYNNLGYCQEIQKKYVVAKENFTKALKIFQQTLPEEHPDINRTEQNIKRVRQSMKSN